MPHADSASTVAPLAVAAYLSDDRVRLLVDVSDPHGNLPLAASRLAMEIEPLELADEPDHDALCDLLSGACEPGEHLTGHVLLEGRAPVPPRDGTLTWSREFFAEGFAEDGETGKVDYWERAENRALMEGEEIAVLVLPAEGTSGCDLLGNEIPVAKPTAERLRAGKGVETEEGEDRIVYRAAIAGRLASKDGSVSVENVYPVTGDVSLATGNIRHTGTVTVSGDVREGARIEAHGDVVVKGMVEPATIVCGGDLIVAGGIVGDDDHWIEAGGGVQARYLNEVHVRCHGDVTIAGQIDHCHVETLGQVIAPRGRIAGGTVKTYRGGRVGQAGAAGSTGTVITIGANWKHDAEQEERRAQLQKLHEARDKLAAAIQRAVHLGALDDARRDAVHKLQAKQKAIEATIQRVVEAQSEAARASIASGRQELAVVGQTYPGVTFRIGSGQTVSDRHYEVPRLVALRRDAVRILPLGDTGD